LAVLCSRHKIPSFDRREYLAMKCYLFNISWIDSYNGAMRSWVYTYKALSLENAWAIVKSSHFMRDYNPTKYIVTYIPSPDEDSIFL